MTSFEYFLAIEAELMKDMARRLWHQIMDFLAPYWSVVILILIVVFVFATIKAFAGRWGTLGSLLYHVPYFGILLLIGLIFGPEWFVSDWYKPVCAVLLNPICFFLSGFLMIKMGILSPRQVAAYRQRW
jgi:hypothetical protein